MDTPQPKLATSGFVEYQRNKGWLIDNVPKDALSELDSIVKEIRNDKNLYPLYNKQLAGSIDEEFYVPITPKIQAYVTSLIQRYEKESGGFLQKHYADLTGQQHLSLIFLDHFWVNFQKKYEYNPPHTHNGLFSFVIWHTIPYNLEDETKKGPGSKKKLLGNKYSENGCFSFMFYNGNKIETMELPVDKSWEGKICLFPADLNHQVYPFYTSDDYRITFSGNIFLETPLNSSKQQIEFKQANQ